MQHATSAANVAK